MREAVHYLPILTTLLAIVFAPQLFRRWGARRPAPHLFWWALGVAAYGAGTVTEALTTLLGWHAPIFRAWYILGALLGGAPLAQGTAYLLLPRRIADWLTTVLLFAVAFATVGVLGTPLDLTLVEPHRLSGQIIEWHWVRGFVPWINIYAFLLLVGGAGWSAFRYRDVPGMRHRARANVLIAVGGLLPGIGGAFTRYGHVEVLYVTELIGLILIYLGFRQATGGAGATRVARGEV